MKLNKAIKKSLDESAGTGGDFLPLPLATEFIALVKEQVFCRNLFRVFPMTSKTQDVPVIAGGAKVYHESGTNTTAVESELTTATVRMTARKFLAQVLVEEDLYETANQDMDTIITEDFARAMGEAEEQTILVGDRNHPHTAATEAAAIATNWYVKDHRTAFNGLLTIAFSAGAGNPYDANGTMTIRTINRILRSMGKYGKPRKNVAIFLNAYSAGQLLEDEKVMTVDKIGNKATIITGELGQVYGAHIFDSAYIPAGYGVAVPINNCVVGDLRKIKFKGEAVIKSDQRRTVVSERIDFQVWRALAVFGIYGLATEGEES